MTHEKLVAGTASPTRYTKIIRNPGAGTKYNRTYQETDYVSRYTKLVAGGKDYVPPAPPAPEYDPPLEATKALWNDHNVYEVGETISAFAATWRFGNPETQVIRSRWQTRDTADDSWVNSPWQNHANQQVRIEKELTTGGQIRFQSQVRDEYFDPVAQVNSFTPVKTAIAPPLVIEGTPTLFGEPYVGETITCAQPNVTGGIPPYSYDYMWLDSNTKSPSNTATMLEYDLGKMVSCYVTVTDSVGTKANVTSNQIGPIQQYTIGDIILTNSNTDTIIENSDMEGIIQGASVTYVADYSGDLPEDHTVWEWKVRQGNVTIRGSINLPYCTFQLPTEYPGACTLSVNIRGKAGEGYVTDSETLIWNITYQE